ncbi:HlyD family type I secretion periplasmic adaptor subunit [Vibrio mimicus]|uniref:Membrane fusion protein (MFP) family protein n=1 Tax=Vibrio mimicus VM603 TaxID=671074 RepID=D2YCN0_VIBMI|nr:HlyD family type I secretion periplasmic adaptor subunit [Vibrio mimicus]EEW07481.1 Leukotoxin secretion protein D [Vibrio mimicus VM603]
MISLLNKYWCKAKYSSSNYHEKYEYLPAYLEIIERPPSPYATTSALSIAILMVAAIVWAIVGKLDIHASATGQVIVSSRSKVIEPFVQGEVAEILVKEGERVNEGETLISLNPVGALAERTRILQKLDYTRLEISRYQNLLSGEIAETLHVIQIGTPQMYEASFAALKADWNEIQAQLASIEAEINVNQTSQQAISREIIVLKAVLSNVEERLLARKKLAQTNSIARMEVLDLEKELLDTQRARHQLESHLEIKRSEEHQLIDGRETYRAGVQKEQRNQLKQLLAQNAELEQELIKANEVLRQMVIKSPVNGTVQQLKVNTLGGVVQPAEELMTIVPHDALLEVEVHLLNKDVGFVFTDQYVEIKVDTFPYTKYGTLSGQIIHVSRDAIKDQNLGMVFPARIALDTDLITIDGEHIPLQPGMSVVAEIKTGNRKIIEYLLTPLQQYQSEAMRER